MKEKLTSSHIEEDAVACLSELFRKTRRSYAQIKKFDKEITWDGELHLYTSPELYGTKNIEGRIPVQIKGTTKKPNRDGRMSFRVDVRDLKNFRNDGGSMFFVVKVNSNTNMQIYYDSFLPYDLKRILESSNGQNQVTLKFRKFPMDVTTIIALLWSFLDNRKKQISTVDMAFEFSDMSNDRFNDIEKFSFTLQGTNTDIFSSVFDIPTYFYAETKSGVSIPMNKVDIKGISIDAEDEAVCFNGNKYPNKVRINKIKGEETITIGEGIKIEYPTGKLRFNEKGTLSERMQDLQLWSDMCVNPHEKFGIGTLMTATVNIDIDSSALSHLEKRLIYLESIRYALSWFGVKDDLQYEKLTDKDYNNLSMLMKAAVGTPLSFIDPPSPVSNVNIANLNIAIYAKEQADGRYLIKHLFSADDINCKLSNDEGVVNDASIFVILKKDDLLKMSNINFNAMYKSITSKKYAPFYSERITWFVLESIHAFDNSKNIDFLDFAENIVKWQIEHERIPTFVLNLIQTIKRRRTLTNEELDALQGIRNSSVNDTIALGACILLESPLEAEKIWEELSDNNRESFKHFPIYTLWKRHIPPFEQCNEVTL